MYVDGKSETTLSEMNDDLLIPNNALIATKANPKYELGLTYKGVTDQLNTSLKRLKTKKVDLFYLHFPDHVNDNIHETLKAVNTLYNEGKFTRFGVSNYSSWQVAEIYHLCDKHDYVKPTVYQGMYNVITRDIEKELIPCLRHYNIVFNAFNPLAGGFLSGKYKFDDKEEQHQEKTRFFNNSWSAPLYHQRYWKRAYFDAVSVIDEALKKVYDGKVNLVEASMRWIQHHSVLNENDGIIMGASKYDHFIENLTALECKEPLHSDVLEAMDVAWRICKPDCQTYFR